MIVLSDTSPLNYLILIGHIDILPALFGQVVVPPGVLAELQHPSTPLSVQQWVSVLPAWLSVRSPAKVDPQILLGHGEAEAISLAVEMHANLLLTDDRLARRASEARGLSVAGTVNVLDAAAERQLIALPTAISKLRATNFHISERILAQAIAVDAQRRMNRSP